MQDKSIKMIIASFKQTNFQNELDRREQNLVNKYKHAEEYTRGAVPEIQMELDDEEEA